jgi:hypothetical protein
MILDDPLVRVESCYDGMEVYVRRSEPGRSPGSGWILGMVQAAMGNTVRVVNPLYKIDTWYRIEEVRVRRSTLCPF